MTAKRRRPSKETRSPKPAPWGDFFDKHPTRVWLIGVGIAVIFCALTFNPNLGIQGDNAGYVILAKSVWKGPFMHTLNFPEPKPSRTLPAGFPLLLAPVAALTSYSVTAMKLWVTLLFVVSLPLLYHWARSFSTATVGAVVLLLAAINPTLLEYSHTLMSEVPFWTVVILGWYLLHMADKRGTTWGNHWMWLGLIAIGFSYWIRSLGLAAILAVGLHYLIRKEWKQLIMSVVVIGAVVVPWMAISQKLGGTQYLAQLILVNPYRPEMGTIDISGLLERIGKNLVVYLGWELPRGALPILPEKHILREVPVWGILVSAVMLVGFIPFLIRQRERVGIYVLLTLGICLMWPDVWSTLRFAIGILPFYIFFVILGFRNVSNWVSGVVSPPIRTVLGTALVAIAVVSALHGDMALAMEKKDYSPNWRDYFAAGAWIQQNTPNDAIVCCRKPYLMHLASGRKTAYFAREQDTAKVLAQMESDGVDYVIYDVLGFSDTPRFLGPTIQQYPDRFQLMWQGSFSKTYLFALVSPADSTSLDSDP